jgi:hypothetical protein
MEHLITHTCTPVRASAPVLAEEPDDSLATDTDSEGEITEITIAETEETFVEACAQQRSLEKGRPWGTTQLCLLVASLSIVFREPRI